MRRKILIGMLIFVFFVIVTVAKADPRVVIELGIDVVPPGEITLEVCETMELKWVIENILHPEVYYVTLTAAIENNTLLEIITAPHYNATYEVYDPDGSLLSSGTVEGVLTMERFAYWDSTGLKLFEMVTWRLPDSVVLLGDGGYINFSFPVHCEDVGTTRIVLFPRATENHGEPITDPANLWQEEGRWYPLYGSYDPWDPDINSGHSFNLYWWRHLTTTAFARASYTVIQVPPALRPSIDVEKTGPTMAHEGDEIIYEIIVNNTGNCDLYNVSVHDTLLGDLTGHLPDTTLTVNEVNTFTVTYTVPTPQVPDVENNVTASGEDELGTPVSDSALWTVEILHPNIAVDKTGPAYAHEGDTITYEFNVTNTGDCDLTVTVSDPMLGGDLWSGTLGPSTSHTFTVDYTVPTPSGDITNTVTATGVDVLDGPKGTVTSTDSHFVDILHPDITVEKTGPNYAHEDDTIIYTINVTNTGDCELSVTVSDPMLGGDLWTGTLTAGESHVFTADYTVPAPSEEVTNTVTATGVDALGGPEGTVTATDDHSVNILHPEIAVDKTGPEYAHEGDMVTYTINVTNTGDCELTVTVSDPLLGGDLWTGTLAAGASHTFTVDYTVPTPSDNVTNTVTATGVDALGGPKGTVTATDDHFVDILHPDIRVEKTGPTYAHEDETITYEITVRNLEDFVLYNVTVTDTLLGDLTAYLPDNTLEVGEVNTFNVAYTVPTSQIPDVENTVTASGEDELGKLVSDSASWNVDILHPSITVDKTGPAYAHEGDLITYTINVTNTGDCNLTVTVSDPMLGGDLWTGTLATGESHVFTVDYTVPTPSEEITNTVTATGIDAIGGPKGTVTATDDHSVDVLHPDITVDKTGPEYAHEGDLVTYTINVTNTGDCELTVTVSDPLLGGDLWTGTLTSGASHTFTVDYTVPAPSKEVTNTVTATGVDALGGPEGTVTATDDHSVNILHPDITVEKTGPAMAHEGDTIIYTINVTNTGDCELSVTVSDPMLTGDLWSGTLALGESHMFTVDYTVPTPSDDITNTVTATGVDVIGGPKGTVTATDDHSVDVLHPNITVDKTGPEYAHEGDLITYTINVTNTGDCELTVTVSDPMLGGDLWTGTLTAGDSHVFTVDYTVPTPSDDITNTVTATGVDALGGLKGTVTATDDHSVDILHPDITVDKSGPNHAHEGDTITYDINVTNTGDCELTVTVSDPLLGGDLWTGTLASSDSYTFSVDYVIPTPSGNVTNTVTATGVDVLGGPEGTVTATDSHIVNVLHPSINVEKTGPASAHEGDIITYTITVNNTGDCDLYNVSVTDTLLGQIWSDGLAFGDAKTFTVDYTVPAGVDPLVNTVTAEGEDELGLTVNDSASWSVDIIPPETHPEIRICKCAWPCIIKAGWWVTYKYKVTNTGDCVLYNVQVTDDKLGFIKWIGTLDVGQTVTVKVCVQLFKTTKNIGTATGEDQFGQEVSDSDDAFVYVRAPHCTHTIGYWKRHPWAWIDISPCEEFPWTTGRVEHYTYMQILWTSPRGDASIQLARQYIAAVLNQHVYGVPQGISETIAAAEAFFQDYPAGSDPQGDARAQAVELANILEDYNSSGICQICGGDDKAHATHPIWTLGLVASSITIAATGIRKRSRRTSRSKLSRKRTTASS